MKIKKKVVKNKAEVKEPVKSPLEKAQEDMANMNVLKSELASIIKEKQSLTAYQVLSVIISLLDDYIYSMHSENLRLKEGEKCLH